VPEVVLSVPVPVPEVVPPIPVLVPEVVPPELVPEVVLPVPVPVPEVVLPAEPLLVWAEAGIRETVVKLTAKKPAQTALDKSEGFIVKIPLIKIVVGA
jgi:hypothetical protein